MNRSHRSVERPSILSLSLLVLISLLTFPNLPGRYSASPVHGSDGRLDASAARAERTRVSNSYGNLPLSFEANEGQADSRVRFISRGSRHTLFLTQTEAVLALIKPPAFKGDGGVRASAGILKKESSSEGVEHASLRMKLVGSNSAASVTGVDRLPGKSNYFVGNDPKKWQAGVSNFARVHYGEVYPGIDMVYYGNQGRLEYDFIVAPGADPRVIRLLFEGARRVRVGGRGDLILRTAVGEVRQQKPFAYQDADRVRTRIPARYIVAANNTVRIELGSYDKSKPVIIDPILVYSTYLGGSGGDSGLAIAIDSAGSAYVTGVTHSLNFPTTPGAFKTTTLTTNQVFVTKLNPSGAGPVYSTYLGSGEGNDIAVDSAGNAYITGTTVAEDDPTTEGAFDRTQNGGGGDLFITKLNATGSGLIYSTFVGGPDADQGISLAVDPAGNAYVTGLTISPDFPITPGALQSEFRGGQESFCTWGDAFITKLNPSGTGLVYSTFLGGADGQVGFGVTVDTAGNAYVSGVTASTDFPVTPGAAQTVHGDASAHLRAQYMRGRLCDEVECRRHGDDLFDLPGRDFWRHRQRHCHRSIGQGLCDRLDYFD